MPTYQLGQVDFLAIANRIYPTVRGNEVVYIKDGEREEPAGMLFEDHLNEVVIINPQHLSYDFVPVDNNIRVLDPQTQNKISICDAMILTEDFQDIYIAFNHRLAYASNRRHPYPASYREKEEQFRKSLGFKLVVSGRIKIR